MALFKEVGKVAGSLGAAPLLGRLFDRKNPADSAMPYLDQIPGIAQQGYQPYIDRGNEAYGQLMPKYQTMTDDPSGFINDIMANYKPSKGYEFMESEMSKGLANEAAAGGYRGGEYHDRQKAELIQGLLGKDMYNYLDHVLGVQGTGLSGLGHVSDQGYGASGNYTDALGTTLGAQAGLAFQGQQQKNKDQSDLIRALLQLAGMAL